MIWYLRYWRRYWFPKFWDMPFIYFAGKPAHIGSKRLCKLLKIAERNGLYG